MRKRDSKGQFVQCENRICLIDNCDKEIYGVGLCVHHYGQMANKRRRGKMSKEDKKRVSDRKKELNHKNHKHSLELHRNYRANHPKKQR